MAKRDFIFSSAELRRHKKVLFLARDSAPCAIAAHFCCAVDDSDTTSAGEQAKVCATTPDKAKTYALAKEAAMAYAARQQKMTEDQDAAEEEQARLDEVANTEQQALTEMQHQKASIDGPGFATRQHHWQYSNTSVVCVEVSEFANCVWLRVAAPHFW